MVKHVHASTTRHTTRLKCQCLFDQDVVRLVGDSSTGSHCILRSYLKGSRWPEQLARVTEAKKS